MIELDNGVQAVLECSTTSRRRTDARTLSAAIADAVNEHGVVSGPDCTRVDGYEVDGYGSTLLMDDAASGIGSPHTPDGGVWPLGIAVETQDPSAPAKD